MLSERLKRKRLARRIRKYLNLHLHPDTEVLGATEGTFLRAKIELALSLKDFFNEVRKSFKRVWWPIVHWRRWRQWK